MTSRECDDRVFSAHLDSYEKIFKHQKLIDVLEEVGEYQALLDDTSVTDEELASVIDALNDRWPYMYQKATAHGRALFYCDNDAYDTNGTFVESEYEVLERDFDGLEVISGGVGVIYRPVIVGGFQVGTRPVLMHRISIDAEDGEWVEGFGDFTNSEIIPATEDEAALQAEAEYFLEDDMVQIDERITDADSTAAAIKSLWGLVFVPVKERHLDGMSRERRRELLSEYLRHMITLDHQVPYAMIIEGQCVVESRVSGATQPIVCRRERHTVYIRDIKVDNTSAGYDEVHVHAEALLGEGEGDSVLFTLPVDSIKGLTSLRELEARKNERYLANKRRI